MIDWTSPIGATLPLYLQLLNRQAEKSIDEMIRKEKASEVLIGFYPKIDKKLSVENMPHLVNIQQMCTLQTKTDDMAIDIIGKLEPSKSEINLPGASSVEWEIAQIRNNIINSSWLTNMARINATPSMIRKLNRNKEVAFIIPNKETELPYPIETTQTDLKPIYKKEKDEGITWGLKRLQIDKLWDQNLRGKDVLIGHLDTGVDAYHSDLKDKIKKFAVIDPRGDEIQTKPFDAGQHGTHTAGTMVGGKSSGISIGVAPEARLASALVLMGGSGNYWQIIKGMEWTLQNKVRILNMSLGGTGYDSIYAYALARATAMGIFTVCSIGNSGLAVTGSPGNINIACGVGAIDHNDAVADFSGGGTIYLYDDLGQRQEINKPDIVAPGVATFSSLPDKKPKSRWGYLNGTSMAAPHVSAIAALLIESNPSATLNDLIDSIYSTAQHQQGDRTGLDSRYGRGIINPLEALDRINQ